MMSTQEKATQNSTARARPSVHHTSPSRTPLLQAALEEGGAAPDPVPRPTSHLRYNTPHGRQAPSVQELKNYSATPALSSPTTPTPTSSRVWTAAPPKPWTTRC